MRTQGKGGHIKLRREASEEASLANALISDFQPPTLHNSLWVKPPSLWNVAIPVLAN